MVNLFRKYQQGILIGVTIVVILTFIVYWNGTRTGGAGFGGAPKVATIYGRSITDTDVQRISRKFLLAEGLQMTDLLQALVGTAQTREQAFENFLWNSYVLDHEADALQINPTKDEMEDALEKVPGLQTDGRFDPQKLQAVVQDKLPPLGFTDAILDELVRDEVRAKKLSALVGSTVVVTPAELANRFTEQNEKMDLAVMHVSTEDAEKGINVSDADAQKIYNQNATAFHTDEQRKVMVASLELTPEQQKLKGRDRTAALQELSDKVGDLARQVVDKSADFAGEAKKAGADLKETGLFTEAQPDAALQKEESLAPAAFKLTPDAPNSDPIQGVNGYYVLHLEQTVPGKQLTFDEAKPKIIAQILSERAAQILPTLAAQVKSRIEDGLKAGKSIADASKAAGVPAEQVPPFSLKDLSTMDMPDIQAILQSALGLADKQLSDFIPTSAGGLFVYMNSRQAPDAATANEAEGEENEQLTRQKQMAAFYEWMRIRRDAARLEIAQR